MNKEIFFSFLIAIALLVGAFFYTTPLQAPLLTSLNTIKSSYRSTIESISDAIDAYFFQAKEVKRLKKELKKSEKDHLMMQELANEINDLYKLQDSNFTTNPQVSLVRTISYAKFGDANRVWIDVPEYNSSKIYGLVYKGLAAGIVINQDERPLALLNRDIKSAYAVYVGVENAPGIVHGNAQENLIVNFIPAWFHIAVGDEVITSGLDNIFFKGLKVGKVLSVTSSQGYQNAIILPYYKAQNPNYFHIIRSTR